MHTIIRRFSSLVFIFAVATLALSAPAAAQTKWGALAYNDRGATSTVWNSPSEDQAQERALTGCRENATVPCRVLSGADHACLAASLGNKGNQQKAFAEARVGLNQARNAALAICARGGFDDCRIRNFMCADGSHRKE